MYTIEQTSPDAPASPEGEGEDDEEAGKLVIEISELQRLSTMIEDIAADCSVVPKVQNPQHMSPSSFHVAFSTEEKVGARIYESTYMGNIYAPMVPITRQEVSCMFLQWALEQGNLQFNCCGFAQL